MCPALGSVGAAGRGRRALAWPCGDFFSLRCAGVGSPHRPAGPGPTSPGRGRAVLGRAWRWQEAAGPLRRRAREGVAAGRWNAGPAQGGCGGHKRSASRPARPPPAPPLFASGLRGKPAVVYEEAALCRRQTAPGPGVGIRRAGSEAELKERDLSRLRGRVSLRCPETSVGFLPAWVLVACDYLPWGGYKALSVG